MTNDDKSSSAQKRFCKVCGCYRSAVSKKKLESFRVVGETLSCPFCGSNLDDAPVEKSKSALDGLFKDSSKPPKASNNSILGNLIRQSEPSSKDSISVANSVPNAKTIVFLDSDKEAHFCRDCEFFMYHPYKSYCCKHEKDISPSDDCKDFTKRK